MSLYNLLRKRKEPFFSYVLPSPLPGISKKKTLLRFLWTKKHLKAVYPPIIMIPLFFPSCTHTDDYSSKKKNLSPNTKARSKIIKSPFRSLFSHPIVPSCVLPTAAGRHITHVTTFSYTTYRHDFLFFLSFTCTQYHRHFLAQYKKNPFSGSQ